MSVLPLVLPHGTMEPQDNSGWKGPQETSRPSSCSKQGQAMRPDLVAQGFIWLDLENLSGQHVHLHFHPLSSMLDRLKLVWIHLSMLNSHLPLEDRLVLKALIFSNKETREQRNSFCLQQIAKFICIFAVCCKSSTNIVKIVRESMFSFCFWEKM